MLPLLGGQRRELVDPLPEDVQTGAPEGGRADIDAEAGG